MERIDDVLALAMLNGLDGKREARLAAIAVSRADLAAAQFCDAVRMFYGGSGRGLPIGLADGRPSATEPMLNVALAQKSAIKSINDTADPATLIRNALMAQYDRNTTVVLSGPATDLVKLLYIFGAQDWIVRKVRLLCVTEPGLDADTAAARKLFAEWPTSIVVVPRDVGEALAFPGECIDKDFSWSSSHPVVAAYRAYGTMPYNAPSWAMAAILCGVQARDNYMRLSDAGTVGVAADGRLTFATSDNGKHRRVLLDPDQKEGIIRTYIELASAKPVERKPRHPA